jgi:hypothetical protein
MKSRSEVRRLELVIENIRLDSIEKLLIEATTEEEVQSGIQMINESINQVSALLIGEGG